MKDFEKEELLIRNESVHFIYLFTMGEYDNITTVRLQGSEEYNTKIIGGLVGTFHSFRELKKLDTINLKPQAKLESMGVI